jgi:DNA-binding NarL/FixJ family response regulator
VARRQISIVAIEPEPVQAEGLRLLVSGHSEFDYRGALPDPTGALKSIARERPDLVIVDGDSIGGDALDLIASVRRVSPRTRPVLWARELDESDAERAFDAGAAGAVGKRQPSECLVECLRAVSGGEVWFEGRAPRPAPPRTAGARLTCRERQILTLIAAGRSNSEIAGALRIAVATVKLHVRSILDKTGTRDRLELTSRFRPLPSERPA